MGVPDLNLWGAMRLFSELGFDCVEIRCAKDGQLDPETVDQAYLDLVNGWSQKLHIGVGCLTSYYRDFVTDRRQSELQALKRVVQIAAELNCPFIRLYGGTDPVPCGHSRAEAWDQTVSGTQELADYAASHGVSCCIETHNGSLTYSATDAVRFVRDVDRPNVGILLDFAWVFAAGETDPVSVVELSRPYLMHCHYKDWHMSMQQGRLERDGCLMGDGDLPWRDFLTALREAGYDGLMTDEYEKYWRPDQLPDAREGMKKNLAFVRSILERD